VDEEEIIDTLYTFRSLLFSDKLVQLGENAYPVISSPAQLFKVLRPRTQTGYELPLRNTRNISSYPIGKGFSKNDFSIFWTPFLMSKGS
jgi:hypothetical protein